MKTITLEEHQLKNLKLFLDRVSVTGITEVTALMEIVVRINEAESKGGNHEVSDV